MIAKPLVLAAGTRAEMSPGIDTIDPRLLAVGIRNGNTFLRDDGTWQAINTKPDWSDIPDKPNDGNFIYNQYAEPQDASAWITGSLRIGDALSLENVAASTADPDQILVLDGLVVRKMSKAALGIAPTLAAAPAGSIQFNDGFNGFAGSSSFIYDDFNKRVRLNEAFIAGKPIWPSPGNKDLDLMYPSDASIRFAGSTTFSDGAAFQGFGGDHPSFAGQIYFDYGSSVRSLSAASLNFRYLSSLTGATTVLSANAAGVITVPTLAGTGIRAVVANGGGVLSTQPFPAPVAIANEEIAFGNGSSIISNSLFKYDYINHRLKVGDITTDWGNEVVVNGKVNIGNGDYLGIKIDGGSGGGNSRLEFWEYGFERGFISGAYGLTLQADTTGGAVALRSQYGANGILTNDVNFAPYTALPSNQIRMWWSGGIYQTAGVVSMAVDQASGTGFNGQLVVGRNGVAQVGNYCAQFYHPVVFGVIGNNTMPVYIGNPGGGRQASITFGDDGSGYTTGGLGMYMPLGNFFTVGPYGNGVLKAVGGGFYTFGKMIEIDAWNENYSQPITGAYIKIRQNYGRFGGNPEPKGVEIVVSSLDTVAYGIKVKATTSGAMSTDGSAVYGSCFAIHSEGPWYNKDLDDGTTTPLMVTVTKGIFGAAAVPSGGGTAAAAMNQLVIGTGTAISSSANLTYDGSQLYGNATFILGANGSSELNYGSSGILSIKGGAEVARFTNAGFSILTASPTAGRVFEVTGASYLHRSGTAAANTDALYVFNAVNAQGTALNTTGAIYGGSILRYDLNIQANTNISASVVASANTNMLLLKSDLTSGFAMVTVSPSDTGIRALSANAVIVNTPRMNASSAAVYIDHVAGLQIYSVQQDSVSPNSVYITNYYAVLIGDSKENMSDPGKITNRWGIYQAGVDDQNLFKAKTTVDNDLEITGVSKGLILTDTATGTRFRVQSTNGNLTLTAV